MAWVKLDDMFPDHRKLAELGAYAPLCGWLYVCGLAYCNRQLTDGAIPKAHITRLAGFEHLSIETGEISGLASFGETIETEDVARLLVRAGLWEDDGPNFRVHDYLHYQPSRESVLREREAAADRKSRWKAARNGARNGARNASENNDGITREHQGNNHPDPDPDPDPDPVPVPARAARHAPGPLAGTLPRDHLSHGWCGARFCVEAKTATRLARRYGDDGDARVVEFLRGVDQELIARDRAYGGPLWLEKHFDAWLVQQGRVDAPPAVAPPSTSRTGTLDQRLAAVAARRTS